METFKGHKLHVRLFDEDTLSRDEFVGKAIVDLEDLAMEEEEAHALEGNIFVAPKSLEITCFTPNLFISRSLER